MRDRRLVDLRNGRTPEQIAEWLADGEPRTVVGLDFAFSFPRWYCEEQAWESGREVWTAVAERGEALMAGPPFWGRPGRPRAVADGFRRAEAGLRAKSVFQVGGAGAVGTGSLRGMPFLLALGFTVWPFDEPGWPRVVEIYPRALVKGSLRKSRWAERHAYVFEHFGDQPAELLERAAGSEDAFDAAVSALVMAEHADALSALRRAEDATALIEGEIWRP